MAKKKLQDYPHLHYGSYMLVVYAENLGWARWLNDALYRLMKKGVLRIVKSTHSHAK